MDPIIIVTVWTTAIFAAIVLSVALKPKFMARTLGLAALITALGGLAIYGYGYAKTVESIPLAIIKATFAVCRIFTGVNFYSEIQNAPLMQTEWMQIIFWLLHVFGLFAAVGAAMTTLGAKLLRKIRLMLSWRGKLSLIYGVNPDTVAFARNLADEGNNSIVFIDSTPDTACVNTINDMGCILRTDADALASTDKFLRSIGANLGRRQINIYTLDTNEEENLRYAITLLNSLEQLKISSDQINLTIINEDTEISGFFLDKVNHLAVLDIPELAARMLTRRYPPCSQISFDEEGNATEDFHCIVIGFGKVGQAVLRQLVMNGQFVNSNFKAAVFDPACQQVMGGFTQEYKGLLKNYAISFFSDDGRSQALFNYLLEHRNSIKYIVVCTGSQKHNLEIEQLLHHFMRKYHVNPLVARCSHHQISHQVSIDHVEQHHIYTTEFLDSQRWDSVAMVYDMIYLSGKKEELKQANNPQELYDIVSKSWGKSTYYNRVSSRAVGDFIPAMLKAAGTTMEEVLENGWKPTGQLLENLSHMEHLRWNAFMLAIGYEKMDEATFNRRAQIYEQQAETNASSRIRIHKDDEEKLHACIIPWKDLAALSKRVSQITGNPVDYKAFDTENVLALDTIIPAAHTLLVPPDGEHK